MKDLVSIAPIYGDYLAHHGIKGQKWGVKNGPPYPLEDDQKTTSEHKRNKKILTAIGVTSGVALMAVGAAICIKHYNMNADHIIKAGSKIQHMAKSGEDLLKPFYASYLPKDNKLYAKNDLFGAHWTSKKELASRSDIKIAGQKSALKAFKLLVATSGSKKFEGLDPSNTAALKSAYFRFNTDLKSPDLEDKKIFSQFYQILSQMGYQGIRDMNDQFQSGAISPIILFGKLGDLSVLSEEFI